MTALYAHTPPNGSGPWHELLAHLSATAQETQRFSAAFGAGPLGALAGLWHDLGKAAPDWQAFLLKAGSSARPAPDAHLEAEENAGLEAPGPEPLSAEPSVHSAANSATASRVRARGPDHSSAGAIHAGKKLNPLVALPLQFAIAGHHAGLADYTALKQRLKECEGRYQAALLGVPESVLTAAPELLSGLPAPSASPLPSQLPDFLTDRSVSNDLQKLRYETFIRMLFSALVDADFLDTEAYVRRLSAPGEVPERPQYPALTAYRDRLQQYLAEKAAQSAQNLLAETHAQPAPSNPSPAEVLHSQRQQVLDACWKGASEPPGAFSLTVPTGGGKTLSSLAFALQHACLHGLERVIIVLPFTAILDQTAQVLRSIFGELTTGGMEPSEVLVEHHSAIDPAWATSANRLASENWDAPLIVTTQVQLFESLFASRTSRCRKLHNLCRSVLILDEAQSLPAGLLQPILSQLQELVRAYRVTLLLATATQPALHRRQLPAGRFPGIDPAPRELIPSTLLPQLFAQLRRVRVEWPHTEPPPPGATASSELSYQSLAQTLKPLPRVLAIVHKRKDAADLYQSLKAALAPGEVVFHLSALMCPAHRKAVLAQVRARLRDPHQSCRLVSTQLIEAGVDVDFPVVYRAMAGLESLAQSAGRCNREGRLPEPGRFVVFHAPTEPPGLLKHHRDRALTLLRANPTLDLLAPETFRQYFDTLYNDRLGNHGLDEKGIQTLRLSFSFQQVSQQFRLIDEGGETLFVPYGAEGRAAIHALRHSGPSRAVFRQLQPFGISVYPQTLQRLERQGALEILFGVRTLVADVQYSSELGFIETFEPGQLFMV